MSLNGKIYTLHYNDSIVTLELNFTLTVTSGNNEIGQFGTLIGEDLLPNVGVQIGVVGSSYLLAYLSSGGKLGVLNTSNSTITGNIKATLMWRKV